MAAPTVPATLAAQGSITTLTPTLATHASGDLLLLVCFSAAQTVTLTTANGWATHSAASNNTTNATGADSASCYVFYKEATSASETAPLIADPGNHLGCISLTISGADTDPANWVTSADVENTAAATAVTLPSVTTASADNLILLICNTSHDQTGGSLSTLTNATISPAVAECSGVTDGGGSVGNVFKGTMASAGATGTSTGTLSVGSRQARATIAIPPAAASSISGTGSGSAAAPTVTSAGTVRVAGAGSGSAAAPTASGAGTVRVSGAGAGSAAAPTGSSSGTVLVSGAGAGSVAAPTVSGAGTILVSGSGSGSAAAPTGSGAGVVGSVPVIGEGAGSAAAPTGTGTGTVASSPISGTGAGSAAAPTGTGAGTVTGVGVAPTHTTATDLRALLIANIAAISPAPAHPPFVPHRHDRMALDDWAEANPTSALRRYSVSDVPSDRAVGYSGPGDELRRVAFQIAIAYPQNHRAGPGNAVSRDELMRRDRHAVEAVTCWRAYASLETLPAAFVSSRASRIVGRGVDYLVIEAVYEYSRLT